MTEHAPPTDPRVVGGSAHWPGSCQFEPKLTDPVVIQPDWPSMDCRTRPFSYASSLEPHCVSGLPPSHHNKLQAECTSSQLQFRLDLQPHCPPPVCLSVCWLLQSLEATMKRYVGNQTGEPSTVFFVSFWFLSLCVCFCVPLSLRHCERGSADNGLQSLCLFTM